MSVEIYYFSGTGNSLFVAKEMARKLNGRLLSVAAAVRGGRIRPQAESVGIVFPCYLAQLYGIPLIVEKFVQQLEGLDSKYVFAVCTCGGYTAVDSLPTLKRLQKLFKSCGSRLSAGFSIRLPMNNLNYFFFQTRNHEKMFQVSEKRIEEICKLVKAGKRNPHDSIEALFNLVMSPIYKLMSNLYVMDLRRRAGESKDGNKSFRELIPLTDRSISVKETCTGCATCAKVCPVENITMVDNRPVWQNRCEMCMACVAWCPTGAIKHWNIREGLKYHHPQINQKDMLAQPGIDPREVQ